MKNASAVALGKLARGVPKQFTSKELERRRAQMTELNRKRALAKKVKGNAHDRRKAERAAK
jgi:hypothetical protein